MGLLRVMVVIARMNVGGPAVLVADLLRSLPEGSFDQRLMTGECAEGEAEYLEIQAPDITATRIPGLGRAVRPGDDARALSHLVREIRTFRPHIIHTHTAKAGVLGRVAARLSGTGSATVHTFHGHLLHGYFSPAKTRAVIEVERALARRSDALIAVGEQVRTDLLEAGIGNPDRFVVIPPGLRLPPARARQAVRSEFGLDPNVPVIAFIGRLTAVKRPDRFVDVVARVHAKRPDVQFLVAGQGDQAQVVREAARRLPITCLGWRDDVQDVLAASDAVMLTSDNEGTPLSLIQAALAGLPVVATDVGSVHDVVVAGQTGLLAPPEASALAAGVLTLLDAPKAAHALGVAGAERARRLYSVESMARSHAELYAQIAAARRR